MRFFPPHLLTKTHWQTPNKTMTPLLSTFHTFPKKTLIFSRLPHGIQSANVNKCAKLNLPQNTGFL